MKKLYISWHQHFHFYSACNSSLKMPLVESWDGGGTLILKMVWLWASGSSTFSQTKSCIMNINTLNICSWWCYEFIFFLSLSLLFASSSSWFYCISEESLRRIFVVTGDPSCWVAPRYSCTYLHNGQLWIYKVL